MQSAAHSLTSLGRSSANYLYAPTWVCCSSTSNLHWKGRVEIRCLLSFMASIESLLNPLPEFSGFALPSPLSACTTRNSSLLAPSRPKRQKMAKDAPIFREGRVRGNLRYPPCEDRDEELAAAHEEFQIHPMGRIAQYPRHIPYNSDKKTFQEKTGREHFEGEHSKDGQYTGDDV